MPPMVEASRLVLASSSPRRKEILARLGIHPRIMWPEVDEEYRSGETPREYVARIAHDKALAVATGLDGPKGREGLWVIAADTIVVLEGVVLGKPSDAADARRMLRDLSGREHVVLTGWKLLGPRGGERGGVEETKVWFKVLRPREIEAYVDSGEPLDKAGAYGIQGLGCFLVERIDGNYENVVGLPACPLVEALQELGLMPGFEKGSGIPGGRA